MAGKMKPSLKLQFSGILYLIIHRHTEIQAVGQPLGWEFAHSEKIFLQTSRPIKYKSVVTQISVILSERISGSYRVLNFCNVNM